MVCAQIFPSFLQVFPLSFEIDWIFLTHSGATRLYGDVTAGTPGSPVKWDTEEAWHSPDMFSLPAVFRLQSRAALFCVFFVPMPIHIFLEISWLSLVFSDFFSQSSGGWSQCRAGRVLLVDGSEFTSCGRSANRNLLVPLHLRLCFQALTALISSKAADIDVLLGRCWDHLKLLQFWYNSDAKDCLYNAWICMILWILWDNVWQWNVRKKSEVWVHAQDSLNPEYVTVSCTIQNPNSKPLFCALHILPHAMPESTRRVLLVILAICSVDRQSQIAAVQIVLTYADAIWQRQVWCLPTVSKLHQASSCNGCGFLMLFVYVSSSPLRYDHDSARNVISSASDGVTLKGTLSL